MNGVEEVDFLSSDAIRNLSFLHKKHMRRRVIPNGSVVLSFCHPERSEGSVYIYLIVNRFFAKLRMAELNDSIVNVLTLSYSLNLQKFPCDYQRKHFPEYNVTSIFL